eukprot:gene12671-12766_t
MSVAYLDVHLLVPQRWYQFGRWLDADLPDDAGVKVHILPILLPRFGKASWYLHFYPGLRRLIRELKPDVIHLWEEPWSIVALQACLLRGKSAYVLEVDQNILKRLVFPFEYLRRFVLKRTNHILSRSPDATAVVEACGYRGPVTYIGYGVDQTTFFPAPDHINPTAAHGLRLGYIGRLVEEKGLEDALDALVLTPQSVTLAIMGEGPQEAYLRRKIAALGLGARVSFQSWGKPADVAAFFHGLDVSLLLTRTTAHVREQFGRVIMESQACGVPVIGSECGAIPDVIGPGGWIVPERNPQALAGCIGSILADMDSLKQCRAAGLVNVEARFTYTAVAQTLAQAWVAAAQSASAET